MEFIVEINIVLDLDARSSRQYFEPREIILLRVFTVEVEP